MSSKRPVPRFLFLDQPTQVFYPPDEVDKASGETDGLKIREADESQDRDIVERIFKWIFSQTNQLNNIDGFQVILTDHAELKSTEFRDAKIEQTRWTNGGNSLIPPEWFSSTP